AAVHVPDHDPAHYVVYCGANGNYEKSRWTGGVLDVYHSVHVAHFYDVAPAVWCTYLAAFAFHGTAYYWVCVYGLGCRPDLHAWYSGVWQESGLPGVK